MINALLFKPFKKTSSTILKAIIKSKVFDTFSGLSLYKNDQFFYLGKCLAFFLYSFNSSNVQVPVNENGIIAATVETGMDNNSNDVGIYNI